MMMMIFRLRFVMVCLLTTLLVACGGGGSGSGSSSGSSGGSSSSSASTTVTQTGVGVFQGSIVTGVHYRAELAGQVKEGETDGEGKFSFIQIGSTVSPVTFTVGGVTLGSVTPPSASTSYTMNVVDLVDNKDPDATAKAVNIQRFLNSINTTGNDNVIQITPSARAALAGQNVKLNEVALTSFDTQANALLGAMVSASALPSGTALRSAEAVKSHMQETKSRIDALRVDGFDVTVGSDTVVADGKSQVSIRVKATKTGGGELAGGLVKFQTTAGTLGGESNLCVDNAATTTAVERVTDASGMAYVMLTPQCQTASATVSVSLGGRIVFKTIQFVSSGAASATSSITVGQNSLPADGRSTTTVTVTLKDANNNPVPDKTPVTLLTDAGSVSASSTTASGRATFTFTAGSSAATANLSVAEFGFLKATITMGVISSTGGKPSSIQMTAGQQQIFVKGVGKTENTSITINVKDDAGVLIKEDALGYAETFNNLRVTLKTRPQGNEYISGIGRTATATSSADVESKTSSSSTSYIAVRTTNGSATVTLTSGTRPGNIELQVDAYDKDGATILASAVSPLVAIASGPAHTITLTEAVKDGIVNLNDYGKGGVYCLIGSALVTDRYGNAVPDGTAIALNLLDTVLASTATGSIAASSADLTDAATNFTTAKVTLSGVDRTIQAGDQVLIASGVAAENRRRFVGSINTTTLTTNAAYTETASLTSNYYVGASLYGGAIHGYSGTQGCNPSQLTTGVATTTSGIAPVRVTYPANKDTIKLGCDVTNTNDTRFPLFAPLNRSRGQVMIVAAVNGQSDTSSSGSTSVTTGKFCYSAMSPASMTSFPTALKISTTAITTPTITLTLKDAGSVPIPYESVQCSASDLNISFAPASDYTDANGSVTFTVTLPVGTATYSATINCQGFNNTSTTISVAP
ncbi:MAG: Ig-like domain-containing protein [Magnetococcales bacterium]|nr:Ig-like domain-containing protein [Magnetococcales bacterium]